MRNVLKTVETVYGCDHVQAAWLSGLPWKMQTVINQGLRAPDTHFCMNVKLVCRWMRSIVLQNADKDHTFMCDKKKLPTIFEIENEINYCSVHFATHFLYALEIIAYKHPDERVKECAMAYYEGVTTKLLHFNIENHHQLDIRLADVDRQPKPAPCPVNDRYTQG